MGGLESGGSWLEGGCSWAYEPWSGEPDPTMVGGVDLIAFVGDDVVVVRDANGLMRPGGSVEPGEHWVDIAIRELAEEAGGELRSLNPFGLLRCHWNLRPDWLASHSPYPDFVRVVAWCDVALVGPPLNPSDAEQILEVLTLTPPEAVTRLREVGNHHHADLVEAGLRARRHKAYPARVRAAVVLVEDNQVALIQRRRGGDTYYLFPGGGADAGETPEQAAAREALEELGLVVEVGPLLATVTMGQNDSVQHYFAARTTGGTWGTGAGAELASAPGSDRGSYDPVWVELSELAEIDVRPHALARALVSPGINSVAEAPLVFVEPPRTVQVGGHRRT